MQRPDMLDVMYWASVGLQWLGKALWVGAMVGLAYYGATQVW